MSDGGTASTGWGPDARRWVAVTVIGFAVSRALYAAAGVRFRYGQALGYLQFIDPQLIRHHFLQSLWYDHAQPPGLNLVWGVAYRILPHHPDVILWPLLLAVGLATGLLLQRVLVRCGISERSAALLSLLWVASPTAVLVESYLLYTPFEVLALLTIGWLLARLATRVSVRALVALFSVAAALALTRTVFHLAWLVALVAFVAVLHRDRWRLVLAASALPLLVVTGWYVKNQVLFDQFNASSWLGVSLSRITVAQLPSAERRRLVANGTLSPYAAYPAFTDLETMGIHKPLRTGPGRGVPLLDERRASNGFANLHQRDYLEVNERSLDDALWVIRHRPGVYAKGLSRSISSTFTAPSAWFGYGINVDDIGPAVHAERLVLGAWSPPPKIGSPSVGRWRAAEHEWAAVAAYLIALLGVPWQLLHRSRRRPWGPDDVVLFYLWATAAFVLVTTAALEFGENNRFRSVTDPLVLVLVCSTVVRWRTQRRAHLVAPPSGSVAAPAGP
ncbi:MAG: DUF2079 domain-containing protein [Actinomycetota bacterium]|nr:DUF2079 domain-containing protein [Actinomycetota bacterium]